MSKKEENEFLDLIHAAYNDVYDKEPELAVYLLNEYTKITLKKGNYKNEACKMEGYLSRHILLGKEKIPKSLINLCAKVNKIAQNYRGWSSWGMFL